MDTKHTPGPWVAIARTNAYIDIEAPEQYGYIAQKVASTSLTNHEANARLIAAAPELLEALIEANAELEYLNDPKGFVSIRQEKIMNKARAAIEKATKGN